MMRQTILLAFVLLLAAGPATARQIDPAIDSGLELFRAGEWEDAGAAFETAVRMDPTGPNATFAMVMAGKSLYRAGQFESAIAALQAFVRSHPDSRYADDARRTVELAREAVAVLDAQPAELGIVLSLSGDEVLQTQELFNGIHLAVRTHNETAERPIRMVFREIGADPASAGAAVRTLAAEGVRVIIGGLFSDQAREAAAAAESAGVVFIAPLATAEGVSMRRSLVFQANPTIEMRGRLMARMAVNGLLLGTLATVSEVGPTGISQRMTYGFVDEAKSLGADVPIEIRLESPTDWYRLDAVLSADTLADIRGLYLPIAGSQTDRTAGAILSGLDRLGVDVRVLGNSEWHNLPLVAQASRYSTTYTNDYFPDPESPLTASFDERYRIFAQGVPGRLAHSGYDVTSFLLEATQEIGLDAESDDIARALREAPAWEGVAHRIEFAGGQVNRAMYYHRYRDGRLELLR